MLRSHVPHKVCSIVHCILRNKTDKKSVKEDWGSVRYGVYNLAAQKAMKIKRCNLEIVELSSCKDSASTIKKALHIGSHIGLTLS